MNRAEAEAVVRQVRRTCRGVQILPPEQRETLFNTYKAAEDAKAWSMAVLTVTETEKAVGIVGVPALEENDWAGLNSRFHQAVFAFPDQLGKGCGADFNDIICAGPFDGQQHEYTCPKCGQKGQYGAPYFELE